MRPLRIVAANQSAAFAMEASCAATTSIKPRHLLR
jgi:hypothetical protein